MWYRTKPRIHNRDISNGPVASKEMYKDLSDQKNANYENHEILPCIVRMAKIKTTSDNKCW